MVDHQQGYKYMFIHSWPAMSEIGHVPKQRPYLAGICSVETQWDPCDLGIALDENQKSIHTFPCFVPSGSWAQFASIKYWKWQFKHFKQANW
jgi:hypothetical protein